MKKISFVLLSLCFVSCHYCSLSHAELTAEQKTRLEKTLKGYTPQKPIQGISDQAQAIQEVTLFLSSNILTLTGGGSEFIKWVTALLHISEHLDAAIPKPVKGEYATAAEFHEKLEKFQAAETLREDLISYFRIRFPIQPEREADSPETEVLPKAPRVSGGMLFTDLFRETTHEGWDLHMENLQTFRGHTGYTDQDGREHQAGDAARNQMMVALSDPLLGQLPLYRVNHEPVTLTKESESFFKELPKDVKSNADGTWVGYRYLLFPDALINTQLYKDPKSREPISIYFMKKVRPRTGRKFAIKKGELERLEEEIRDEQNNHQKLHEALELRKKADQRKQARARDLLKTLADKKIARAQYEIAVMLLYAEGGPMDLSQSKNYAAMAHSQGLPMLSYEGVTADGVTKKTKKGAKYLLISNHPKLGKAWKDPRGLIWMDQTVKKDNGEIYRATWQNAYNYCLNLNPHDKQTEVENQLQAREELLTPFRASYYNARIAGQSEEVQRPLRQALQDKSKEFGAIRGCYLPSREEWEEVGVDMGFDYANHPLYSPEIFSELKDNRFWSSSGSPDSPAIAFGFDGSFGGVGNVYRNFIRSVACVCHDAASTNK